MIKIPKNNEISQKDFLKIKEQINKIENNLSETKKSLKGDLENSNKQNKDELSKLRKEISELKKNIENINESFNLFQQKIQDLLKNQEKIILDILNKFKKQMKDDKTKIEAEIEKIKAEQDTLKISFTINENKLLDIIKLGIENEVKEAIKGKEYEILMKYWIDELKEIISNFDNLKKKKPKEFVIQLNEIADTIEIFKEKIKSKL
ncbi:MAG: hypothetical protein ACP6IY_17920 [Promethearchaeia archaeon]